ncbi:MAG: hypothetical protein A3H41_01465 [Omnitrophica WOR_2 bacterium RIFCSPLOWO2_02_FULL_45_28]|nr:MAG: hypothetical protein A3H41_01465 [Omnitrophica WOR_2 bacterium RIFCSPLOWO2_02_FULL_45_28]
MVKTLVFIHGWASTQDVWQSQRDYFAGNYEVILPDISRAKEIKEAAEIVNVSLAIKRDFVLIGWSLGWLVVLELLKNFKISPQGIVAVNSTPKLIDDGYLGAGPTRTHLAKMIRDCKHNPEKMLDNFYKGILTDTAKDMLKGIKPKNIDTFGGAQTPPFPAKRDPAGQKIVVRDRAGKECAALSINPEHTTVFRPWCGRIDYDRLIYGLYILRDCDYRDFISEINIPALIIVGAKDGICPPQASEYMRSRIKHAQLKILDCGHMPFLDKANEFNTILENFVKEL